jgi:hypothetical protein
LRANDVEACLLAGGGADAGQWQRYRSFLVSERMLPRQGLPASAVRRSYRDKDVVRRKHVYFSGPTIKESKDGDWHVCVKEGLNASILPHLPLCVSVRQATS